MEILSGFRAVFSREIRIMRQRPIYFLAGVIVVLFNAVFYLTFFKEGIPQNLPVGIVDQDCSTSSRIFCSQLDATPTNSVVMFDDVQSAQVAMERGKINGFLVIPDGFNDDVQAFRRPTVSFYVNMLYYVGGTLTYKNLVQMSSLAVGYVQRQLLRAKGVNEHDIMGRIQPILLDQHQIGNVTTNYGVYLVNVLLPGVLGLAIILTIIYTFGAELKYGTSRHLLHTAGGSMFKVIFGKLAPYTIMFTVEGLLIEYLLFHWMHYPLAGSLWNMFFAILLYVIACEAVAIFIVGMLPTLRLSVSIGAIYSVLAFSLSGFTLPIDSMPRIIQGWAAAFPLRHYYVFFVNEAIFANGFAGYWQEIVHLLCFCFLPMVVMRRLHGAYLHQNFPRN